MKQLSTGPGDEGKPNASFCTAAEPVPAESFECCVCCDLLLDPVVFPCGHDSCCSCYLAWMQQSRSAGLCPACPLCRYPLPETLGVCRRLKATVEELHPDASEKRRREALEHPGESKFRVLPESAPYSLNWLALASCYSAAALYACSQVCLEARPIGDTCYVDGATFTEEPPCTDVSPGVPIVEVALLEQERLGKSGSNERGVAHAQEEEEETHGSGQTCNGSPTFWQSSRDKRFRLQMARSIHQILKQKAGDSLKGERLLSAVRMVEVGLYRGAKSRSEYAEEGTLRARVLHLIQATVLRRLQKKQAELNVPGVGSL